MAEKVSFSTAILQSDAFFALPMTAQYLYMMFNVVAQPKGLVINPKATTRLVGCSSKDVALLIESGFLIPTDDGHFIISHWEEHNTTKAQRRKRLTYSYRQWRDAVIKRDKVCQMCGSSKRLEVHHIKPYAAYPELRQELSNGITLCHDCHVQLHKQERKDGEKEDV